MLIIRVLRTCIFFTNFLLFSEFAVKWMQFLFLLWKVPCSELLLYFLRHSVKVLSLIPLSFSYRFLIIASRFIYCLHQLSSYTGVVTIRDDLTL